MLSLPDVGRAMMPKRSHGKHRFTHFRPLLGPRTSETVRWASGPSVFVENDVDDDNVDDVQC